MPRIVIGETGFGKDPGTGGAEKPYSPQRVLP